jgi:hypothetical protein
MSPKELGLRKSRAYAYLLIMNKINDLEVRKYYIVTAAKVCWARDVLVNQIKADAYERHKTMPKTHNFQKAPPMHLAEQVDEAIKSEYNLDFLLEVPVQDFWRRCLSDGLYAAISRVMCRKGGNDD